MRNVYQRKVICYLSTGLLAGILGCSSSPSGHPDGSTGRDIDPAMGPDGAPPAPNMDAGRAEQDAASAPDERDGGRAPDAPSTPTCQLECETELDCVTPSPAFDHDNYTCDDGLCVYAGCNSDRECQDTFMQVGYACREHESGIATCTQLCDSPVDCGSLTPAFDADNYACEDQRCEYLGCHTDLECAETYQNGDYVCRAAPAMDLGVPTPTATRNCVLRCDTSFDCQLMSAAFDHDNYTCEDGLCVYAGCNDDFECQSTFQSTRYVCR